VAAAVVLAAVLLTQDQVLLEVTVQHSLVMVSLMQEAAVVGVLVVVLVVQVAAETAAVIKINQVKTVLLIEAVAEADTFTGTVSQVMVVQVEL
jgi:hypothetical protein